MLLCSECGRDLEVLGSDNMSFEPGYVLCEECFHKYSKNIDMTEFYTSTFFSDMEVLKNE